MNSKKSLLFFTFPIVPYKFCCLKVIFGGLGGFIGEKYWLNTKITIFWWFLSQNGDLLLPYLRHELQKIIIFFTFSILPYILCCLKVIFGWFGRIYWGEILIKYKNIYDLTILAPKCDFLPPYPGHEVQKIIFLFYFFNSSLHIVWPTGVFWWFGKDLLGKNINSISR